MSVTVFEIGGRLFSTGAYLPPFDGREVAPAWPILSEQPKVSVSLDSPLGGAGKFDSVTVEISNQDGAFDWMLDANLQGQACRIFTANPDGTDQQPWLTATLKTIEAPNEARLRFVIHDPLARLDVPITDHTYLGNNVPPLGIEGDENLKDKPKPWLLGVALNFKPVCVNYQKQIYQFHDGVAILLRVCDRGADLTRGQDYTSSDDLLNTSPASGFYRVLPALGLFRLGSLPQELTCDAERRIAGQASPAYLLAELAGTAFTNPELTTDRDALHASQPWDAGLWISDNSKRLDVMKRLAEASGVWFAADPLGGLRIGRIEPPSGVPVLELTGQDIKNDGLKIKTPSEQDAPPRQITVTYGRNATPQKTVAGSVSDARKAWLTEASRQILQKHPERPDTAPELTRDSYFIQSLGAQALLDQLDTLSTDTRRVYEITAGLQTGLAALQSLRLGATCRVAFRRFGLQNGKLLRVIGYELRPITSRFVLTLWG